MAGPKLLPKRIVNAEVATQKAQDIKKGLDLAKKIDALRETKLEEEGKLEQFRMQSVAIVQAEIAVKIQKLDELDDEIRLKESKSAAILPSVEDQWQLLHEAQTSFQEDKKSHESEKMALQQAIGLNIQREDLNKAESQRIEEDRRQSQEALQRADQIRNDAVQHLQEARSQGQSIVNKAIEREQAVAIREQEVEARENDIAKQTVMNGTWERDLSARERKLKINMETFIKSQNYLKNKN